MADRPGHFLSEDELVRRCAYLGIPYGSPMFPTARKLIFDLAFHGGDYGYNNVLRILKGPAIGP